MNKTSLFNIFTRVLLITPLLVAVMAATESAGGAPQQELNFRLINIERRLDQLQSRIDFVERQYQNQATQNIGSSDTALRATLELQRQQLSLAEQVVTMQRQMLELQKKIDRLGEKNAVIEKPEKKEASKEEAKPKPKKP